LTIRLHIWSPNIVIGNFFMTWITTKFSNFQDQSFINTFFETWLLLLFLMLQLSNQSIKGRQLFLSNDGFYESFITSRKCIQHDMHYGFFINSCSLQGHDYILHTSDKLFNWWSFLHAQSVQFIKQK
jgi:hypothetical protein